MRAMVYARQSVRQLVSLKVGGAALALFGASKFTPNQALRDVLGLRRRNAFAAPPPNNLIDRPV